MFNWIARWLALYIAIYILVDPSRAEKTLSIPLTARFPILVRGTDFSYAVFLSVFVALVLYFVLWHTTMGYEVRAAGLNPTAARYGGIRNKRTMIVSFVLGGITAGLAGATIVMGNAAKLRRVRRRRVPRVDGHRIRRYGCGDGWKEPSDRHPRRGCSCSAA